MATPALEKDTDTRGSVRQVPWRLPCLSALQKDTDTGSHRGALAPALAFHGHGDPRAAACPCGSYGGTVSEAVAALFGS